MAKIYEKSRWPASVTLIATKCDGTWRKNIEGYRRAVMMKHEGTQVVPSCLRLSSVWLSKRQIISAVTAALEELPKEEELKDKAASLKQDGVGYDGLWQAWCLFTSLDCTQQGEILTWIFLEMKRRIWNLIAKLIWWFWWTCHWNVIGMS